MTAKYLLFTIAFTTLCACSDSDETCPNLSGNWTITSHCESSFVGETAQISQTGCALAYGGAFSDDWTGTIDSANTVTASGIGDGTMTCTGALNDNAIVLSCTPSTCNVILSKQ